MSSHIRTFALIAALIVAAMPPSVHAEQWQGTVVAIADGDTLTLLDGAHRTHRIRLDGIDAPERKQPYGQRARESLAALTHGRSATADCEKIDRYGRDVCRVTVDGVDVGLEQLRRGLAWHYLRYAHEQTAAARAAYSQAEIEAKREHSGLWSTRDPTPPWDFRRAARGS